MNSLINMIIVLFYLIQLKLKRRKKCEISNVDGLNGDKGWPIKNTFANLKTRQISMLLETSKFLQTIVNHYLYNIILCIRNLWQTHPQFQERLTSSRSSRYAMLRKKFTSDDLELLLFSKLFRWPPRGTTSEFRRHSSPKRSTA